MDSPEGPKDATADASRRSRSTREPEETIARLHCEIIKDEDARDASLWRFRVWGDEASGDQRTAIDYNDLPGGKA